MLYRINLISYNYTLEVRPPLGRSDLLATNSNLIDLVLY